MLLLFNLFVNSKRSILKWGNVFLLRKQNPLDCWHWDCCWCCWHWFWKHFSIWAMSQKFTIQTRFRHREFLIEKSIFNVWQSFDFHSHCATVVCALFFSFSCLFFLFQNLTKILFVNIGFVCCVFVCAFFCSLAPTLWFILMNPHQKRDVSIQLWIDWKSLL